MSEADPLPPITAKARVSAVQREEPVAAVGRTRGKRRQADVRFGPRRSTERQLYEVQLTPDCYRAVSLLRRLLPCRANWRYRPISDMRCRELVAPKRPVVSVTEAPEGGPVAEGTQR